MRLVQLSELASDIHHPDDIVYFLQTLLTLRPDALEARRLLRTLEVDLWEDAQNSRNPMKRIHSKALSFSAHSTMAQADKALKEHQYGQAMALAEEILATLPSHEKANLILADAAKALEMPSTVAFAYEMICYGKEDDLHYLHLLAEANVAEGDAASARQIYKHILSINPDDHDAIQSVRQLQNTPQTLTEVPHVEFKPSAATQVLRTFPFENVEAQLENLQKQVHEMETMAQIDIRHEGELSDLQRQFLETKLQLLYHRAAQNPEDYTLRYELGHIYLDLNMFAEAKALFTGVLEQEDLRLAAFKSLCHCLAKELAQQEHLAYNIEYPTHKEWNEPETKD